MLWWTYITFLHILRSDTQYVNIFKFFSKWHWLTCTELIDNMYSSLPVWMHTNICPKRESNPQPKTLISIVYQRHQTGQPIIISINTFQNAVRDMVIDVYNWEESKQQDLSNRTAPWNIKISQWDFISFIHILPISDMLNYFLNWSVLTKFIHLVKWLDNKTSSSVFKT